MFYLVWNFYIVFDLLGFMKGVILHTILAAKRDMLFRGSIIAILIATGFGFFMGSNALAEMTEMKIVYSAYLARLVVILCMMIFVCFHLKRLFENREIEMMITKPISRAKIIIGFFVGFCMLLIPIVLMIGGLLFAISDSVGLFLWCVSFLFEAITVISFTMFFALFVESPVFSLLLSISVYILSRIIGSFIAYINIGARANEWFVFQSFVEIVIKIVSVFMPRLDFCAKSAWLLGNIDYSIFLSGMAQCTVYTALLLAASVFEFNRKNF